jgi:hypothetical protein
MIKKTGNGAQTKFHLNGSPYITSFLDFQRK